MKGRPPVRTAGNRSNGLIRWMLDSPADRLGVGLVVPLGALAALIALLLWNPYSRSDNVIYDPRNGAVVEGRVFDKKTGREITQERVRVTYWEKWSGFEGQPIKDAVDNFNRRQDSIYIELIAQGDISQKVRIATAGGDPPDLAGLYSFDVPVFASQNALVPLDDMINECGIGPATYVPAYWRLCTYRGRARVLPTAPSTLALHWNKKLFREAGLDPDRPPRTLNELDEYAEKLTKKDRNGHLIQIGFLPSEPGWWKYSWGFWFGAELWDGKDRITANSPEHLAAMKWVKSYVDKFGYLELDRFKKTFGGFSSPDNAFFTGKVAMEIQGVWMANFIARYAPEDFEWGAAAFPSAVPGLENVSIAEADVIGIPRGAKHPKEAFEFIKFMATPEGMEILCRGQVKNSPLTRTSSRWERDHTNPYIGLFSDLARSPNCKRTPPICIWLEYKLAFDRAFDDVWTGRKNPEEALDELQKEMQRRFDHEVSRARALGLSIGEDD